MYIIYYIMEEIGNLSTCKEMKPLELCKTTKKYQKIISVPLVIDLSVFLILECIQVYKKRYNSIQIDEIDKSPHTHTHQGAYSAGPDF